MHEEKRCLELMDSRPTVTSGFANKIIPTRQAGTCLRF